MAKWMCPFLQCFVKATSEDRISWLHNRRFNLKALLVLIKEEKMMGTQKWLTCTCNPMWGG